MDSSYFIEWGHMYVIHFGAWMSLAFAAALHKNGIPKPKEIPKMLLAAIILASLLSVFSSHSHNHYIQHVVKK